MLVLGIETSCDETAVAILRDGREVLADLISSQVEVHRPYGGVVPELASRQHVENLVPLLDACLEEAGVGYLDLDGIAVTRGPGLIGALLVGVTAAKALSLAHDIPLVGVHHVEAHLHSVTLHHEVERPYIAVAVSGGHTEIYLAPSPAGWRLLARTRDDAAGEAFDKVGKILGLGYPAGPLIDRLVAGFGGRLERFPIPKMSDGSADLSFSGLKTVALKMVQSGRVQPWEGAEPPAGPEEVDETMLAVLAGFQEAVADQILGRCRRLMEAHGPVRGLALCGGVAANSRLRERTAQFCADAGIAFWVPPPRLSTDNAVMVAALGDKMLGEGRRDGLDMEAVADLPVETTD